MLNDSLHPYQIDIEKSFEQELPVIIRVDSVQYYMEEPSYDDYYRTITGKFKPLNPIIRSTFPRIEIAINRYSNIEEHQLFRLLDIDSMVIRRQSNQIKTGQHPCEDMIILNNGDTIKSRVLRINDGHIDYQKCSQNLKRVYGYETHETYKVIFFNGDEHIYYDKAKGKNKNSKYRLQALVWTAGFLGLFGVTAFIVGKLAY